jgi:Flp pilus assembly protein TadD
MTRFATPLIVLLLCGTALAGCASDDNGLLSDGSKTPDIAKNAVDTGPLPTDVDSGVRQAHALREAGRYDAAIHTLSQLMLVASDDPSVVSEYGKTLVEKGRGQDAVDFLTRAIELRPTEWSYYSALGVAYDEVGDEASARTAYERALKLKPNDPSVLNNYALSRMLAKDPQGARELIARAEQAGGASDPKIARNIELVNKLAAEAPPEPKTASSEVPAGPALGAPVPVNTNPLPPVAPSAQNAAQAPAKLAEQKKPADAPVKTATHEPKPLTENAVAKADHAAKPAKVTEAAAQEKAADKPDAGKSEAKADSKSGPAVALRKETTQTNPQVAEAKPAAKPAKAADSKPADKKGIPALRMTASVD